MATFAVYEIWTRCHIIEADSLDEAYDKGLDEACASPDKGLYLSNWHAYPIVDKAAERCRKAEKARQLAAQTVER